MQNHMRAQWGCSREWRIALYKQSSINDLGRHHSDVMMKKERRFAGDLMFLFPLNRPIVCPSPLTATSMETSGSGKSPFLISVVVSVDIKHHVYLLSGKTGFRRLPFYVHDLVWLGEVVFMNWYGQVIFMKWFGQVVFMNWYGQVIFMNWYGQVIFMKWFGQVVFMNWYGQVIFMKWFGQVVFMNWYGQVIFMNWYGQVIFMKWFGQVVFMNWYGQVIFMKWFGQVVFMNWYGQVIFMNWYGQVIFMKWFGQVVFMNWYGQVIFMKWFGQVVFMNWYGQVIFMNWYGQVIFMKWFGQVIFSSCLMFRSDHACLNDTQKEKKRRQGTLLPVNNYLFVSAFKPDGETDLFWSGKWMWGWVTRPLTFLSYLAVLVAK